ncbi:hypothetical protein DLM86_01315 [Paenibacillus flagellatus]|uniref:Uncharacterized protein n=1 Tax=Paenibacillus flagellatus TaxID=2211139 RepID=A0A2V5KFY4_9BACL|nr:hypothetical protein DLM86_01315 [Paenibacillus flagellatus]
MKSAARPSTCRSERHFVDFRSNAASSIYGPSFVLGIGFGFALLGYGASASVSVQDHEQGSVASYVTALQGRRPFRARMLLGEG